MAIDSSLIGTRVTKHSLLLGVVEKEKGGGSVFSFRRPIQIQKKKKTLAGCLVIIRTNTHPDPGDRTWAVPSSSQMVRLT